MIETMKVRMESCKDCGAGSFIVDVEDLIESEGYLDCENCGRPLLSADKSLSIVIANEVKLRRFKESWVRRMKQEFYSRERQKTNFGCANDRLSRAMSKILSYWRANQLGEWADAGFDGGEFSGPAHRQMEIRRQDEIALEFGWQTYEDMIEAASKVCQVRQLYMMGFIG